MKTAPQGVLWVCADCYFDHHLPGEIDPDYLLDRKPWSLFPEGLDLTAGLDCGIPDHWNTAPDEHSEECEQETFSWNACQGCGSYLGGSRYAFTWWADDEKGLI